MMSCDVMCGSYHILSHNQLTLWVSYDTVSVAVKMGVYLRGNASLVEEARKAGIIGDFVLGLVYTAEGEVTLWSKARRGCRGLVCNYMQCVWCM